LLKVNDGTFAPRLPPTLTVPPDTFHGTVAEYPLAIFTVPPVTEKVPDPLIDPLLRL
jgi:hypothetical protein